MKERESFEGHRERLRKRALSEGFDVLRENQLIELLLCYAVPRVDVSDVAQALIARFGAVTRVLEAPPEALLNVPGVTKGMADWLAMTGELLHAYSEVDPMSPARIWRFVDMSRLLSRFWRDVPAPQCRMYYVDFEGRLLMQSVLCNSLAWADPRHATEIVREALSIQAKSAFLVLFTGTEPLDMPQWELDYLVSLSRTLRAIGVELLDCVLAGEAGMLSLSREGLLDQVARESTRLELHENYRLGSPGDEL